MRKEGGGGGGGGGGGVALALQKEALQSHSKTFAASALRTNFEMASTRAVFLPLSTIFSTLKRSAASVLGTAVALNLLPARRCISSSISAPPLSSLFSTSSALSSLPSVVCVQARLASNGNVCGPHEPSRHKLHLCISRKQRCRRKLNQRRAQ